VDAHHRRLQCREHQLAGAPGVFEATAGATVVEAIEQQATWPISIQNLPSEAGVDRERVVPARIEPVIAAVDERILKALLGDAVVRVHVGGHLATARRRQAAVDAAIAVRNDHDVPAATRVIGDRIGHGPGHRDGQWRYLPGEVNAECILLRGTTAFAVGVPLVDVIATTHDAEVAGQVGSFSVDWRQCDAILDCSAHGARTP
jgi:hypothetical protein